MNRPILCKNFTSVKKHVEQILRHGLSDKLVYHSKGHTIDDVLPAAKLLARHERVTGDRLYLLLTAAVLHDIGYVQHYMDHEEIAGMMAEKLLPQYGYVQEQIEVIAGCLRATKMPQTPRTLLEKIICDADMISLSSQQYFISSMKLRSEACEFRGYVTMRQWLEQQFIFLEEHTYFTASARTLWDTGKKNNIAELKAALGYFPDNMLYD